MKKSITIFTTVTALLFGATSCITIIAASPSSDHSDHKTITASKKYETKNITASEFNAISTSSSVNVIYTQATGEPSVEIYAPDNVIDYITVEVKGKTLVVGMTKNIRIKGQHKKEIHVSAPAVDNLKASSSGDIILKNGLTATGKISMKASSSGDIKGNDSISCTTLTLSASSSGNIELKNISCTDLSAQASSSGDIYLSGKCENATYKVSSSGDIKAKNLKAVNVKAETSSSGDIDLSGECENATYKASSSGDIKAKNLKAVNVKAETNSSGDISCHVSDKLIGKASSGGEISYKGNPSEIDFSPKKGLKKID